MDPDQTAYVGNFKKGYYHIHIRVTATFVLLLGPFEQISFPRLAPVLKHFFINVSHHILVASLTLMALFQFA